MHPNTPGNIINILFALVGLCIFFGIGFRFGKNTYTKEKGIRAKLIKKEAFSEEVLGKMQMPRTEKKYTATFSAGKKKYTFFVSADTYFTLREKETGLLRFKGTRFLSFETFG